MKLLRCETCGKIVAVVKDTVVPAMCCGKPMVELVANTTDGATEKHVPVASIEGDILTVKVGEVAHPMMEAHWITNIIVVYGNTTTIVTLNPGEAPETTVALNGYKGHVDVYEYCNLHGLWKAEIES